MKYITPEDILKLVNFNIEENNSWQYDKNNKDMYSYQAEGSAGLWNRLESFGLAILADEVGMGKTYQALAVVAKQFKEKPNSKILIITPRYEVLRQWKDEEYEQFKVHHLKNDNLFPPKNRLDELSNLSKGFLPHGYKKNEPKIVFAKTTSFQIATDKIDIKKCKKDACKFDLIIVDEAHKFRTADKSVKRNTNAREIFKHIGSKILLMTATPLHSSKNDIFNIVNVFKSNIFTNHKINSDSDSIMSKLMIRRLRVMGSNINKYHYRTEEEIPVEIKSKEHEYKDELFFAMLQKKMVDDEKTKLDYSKSKNMLDLLEGTSFDENFNREYESEIEKNTKKESGAIKKIFNSVVESFKNSYDNTLPSNQKYNNVLNHIESHNEKALVFVRRRASAIELSRQYIESFDKKAWFYLTGLENYDYIKRETFDMSLQSKKIDSKVNNFIKKKIVQEYFDYYKEYIQLPKGTKNKTILINMATAYFYSYQEYNFENFEEFKKNIQSDIEDDEDKKENKISEKLPKSKILSFFKKKPNEISTSASRFIRKFDVGKSYGRFFYDVLPLLVEYKYPNEKKKEINELIKSAILHSSFGVLELFKCDLISPKYESFCKNVKKIIEKSILKKEIENFLENFDKYEKYLISNNNEGNKNKEKTDDLKVYNEKIFHNAQPAYAYLSNTKNKSVIARFNSPFFPNLLCGTSTLQEGLNLHLQCNKIYHFGSAHTMGDDEQRIGRVDRIHGKMYRELKNNPDSKPKLHVNYPYLKNTFDEENLRGMLCNKRATEKKIDNCQIESNITNVKSIVTQNQCEKPIEELVYKSNTTNTDNYGEPFGWEINLDE